MGQKVNPHGLRVGVIKDWDSKWFAKDHLFGDILVEDKKIRDYLKQTLFAAGVPTIRIERDPSKIRIFIHCAKPGMVIGKGGAEIEKLRLNVEKLIGKPLDARVTLYVSEAASEPFAELESEDLAPLCIVSELKIVHGAGEGVRGENFDGLTVHVEPSVLPRCARCWTRSATVGTNEKHPTLCARCASVVG